MQCARPLPRAARSGRRQLKISDDQIDYLRELVNIGIGRAAADLNSMVSSHVHLQAPIVEVLTLGEIAVRVQGLGGQLTSAVRLVFKGTLTGTAWQLFPSDSAAKLVSLLTEDQVEDDDLDSLRIGALVEVGNILLNGVMGVISNEMKDHLTFTVPSYVEGSFKDLLIPTGADESTLVVWAQTHFVIQQRQISGQVMLLFEIDSLSRLFSQLPADMAIDR